MTAAILRGLGIDWNERPYFQSDRVGEHTSAARKLLATGQAYPGLFHPEELARGRANIAAMAGEATRAARRGGRSRWRSTKLDGLGVETSTTSRRRPPGTR